jgi:hypothetical protein
VWLVGENSRCTPHLSAPVAPRTKARFTSAS